jgi:hypothetical protein
MWLFCVSYLFCREDELSREVVILFISKWRLHIVCMVYVHAYVSDLLFIEMLVVFVDAW